MPVHFRSFFIFLAIVFEVKSYAQTSVLSVPFEGCEKSFGSGENIWYFCPDRVLDIKTDSISPTDNALVQSLPIRGKIRLSFVCKSSEPLLATIAISDQSFQLAPDNVLTYHDFEALLGYMDAGTIDWKISGRLRKADYVSVKKGCSLEVASNLSVVHSPTLKVYGEYLSKNIDDLTGIIEKLDGSIGGDLSEVRLSLDSAIKNIDAVLAKTTDPATKFLLTQSQNKLKATLKNITQSCGDAGTPLCTNSLALARQKAQQELDDHTTEIDTLSVFLQAEIDRLKSKDKAIADALQDIINELK